MADCNSPYTRVDATAITTTGQTDGRTDGHPTVAFRSDGRERVRSKMTLVRDAGVVLCAGFVVVVVVCVERQLGVVGSTGRHTAVDR